MIISGASSTDSSYALPTKTGRTETASRASGATGPNTTGAGLTPEEQAQVKKLQARDREVRAHEMAHMAAGAGMTSGASFTYQRGPDGVNYAIGGEVRISTSPGRTPEETLAKARQIRAAALAPADPSGQDRAVAASASAMEREAQAELARSKVEGSESADKDSAGSAIAGAYSGRESGIGKRLDVFA